ncbi:MAG: peptidylprolyl isomerase [Eubacterium sp.]|nr:peptidylprolyl isomerase [Eubacterium sp.]
MAKKNLDEDLLSGGSINAGGDKKAKKSSSKSAKNAGVKIPVKTKKIIQSVVCVVIVLALLVTYVATGAVRKGFIASLSLPAQTLTGMTVSNGENKIRIKVSTYNFYFASTYNNMQSQKQTYEQYGLDLAQFDLNVDFNEKLSKQTYTDSETNEEMTWEEHMHDLVLESIESTYTFYLAAVAANNGEEPEITDEQKEEINSTLSQYRETAEKYGYTLSGYLVRAMGKGVTESVFRRETTRQYIASNYRTPLGEDLSEKEYTAEDINKYKDENLDALQSVDIKIFECDNADQAKEFTDKLAADGSNFADLCVEYSTADFDKKAYADDTYSTIVGATKSSLQSRGFAIGTADAHEHEEGEEHSEDEELTYSGLDWLFSADRVAGDIYNYSTSVVYVISPVSLSDRNTINVRHILIAPELDEDVTDVKQATDAQWNAAYDKAREILDSWDGTEDGFAQLAKDNSSDGSASTGGLYSNVVTGQMVNPFSNWCFDSSRQTGDTGIVRTEFGYHIMYFAGANDQTIWQYTSQQALASEDTTSATEQLEEEYTLKENWFGSRYFEKDVDISN